MLTYRPGRDTPAILGLALLAVCIVIQARVIDPSSPDLPRTFAALLVAGGLAGACLAASGRSIPDEGVDVAAGSRPPAAWLWLAALPAIAGAVVAALLVGGDEWSAQWWWIGAMAVPVLVLAGEAGSRAWRGWRARLPSYRLQLALVVVLGVLALVPRLTAITASPPFLLGDEAQCGLYGRLFDSGQAPLLSISWFGLPMLSYAISGLGLSVFGNDFAGLRDINGIIGAAGVVLLYLLGKEWFGRTAGIFAALLDAVWFLPLELSRDGIHYIQGPVCITLTLLLCTVWLKRGGALPALLAGMSCALDLQVYWSARVGPLLALLLLGLTFARERGSLRARRHELGWMATGGVAAGVPVLALFHAVPGSFNGHQGGVSIFSSDPAIQGHLVSVYGHVSKLSILGQQIWRVATAFNARGDAASIFGQWGKPMLDTISGALLPAAVVLGLARMRRTEYLVTLAWAGSVAAANALTIDPPLWNRLLALTPALALLVGVLLAQVWEALTLVLNRRLALAVPALLLGAIAALNLQAAFVDYPDVARQLTMSPTYVGEYLASAPGAAHTVLLSDGTFYVDYEPIRFLAPHSGGCTLMPGQPLRNCPVARTSTLFVLLPGRVKDLPWLRRVRPGGRVTTVATVNYGHDRILAYRLPGSPP